MRKNFVLFVLLTFIPTTVFAAEPTAQEIMDKALDRNTMSFQSGRAQLSLLIQSEKGDKRERTLDVKSKRTDGLTKTLVKLTAPKEVKGQAFLFKENRGEDDVWMFLPAFKVVRRIESGQKKGAFLGSHFSYADLESRDIRSAKYKKLADEKIGKHKVFVIESTPEKDSDYDKVVVYIRQSDFITLKAKFFKKGSVAKTLFVEKLDQTSKGETYAKQITVRVGKGFTRMSIGSLDDSEELADAIFSKDALGK